MENSNSNRWMNEFEKKSQHCLVGNDKKKLKYYKFS